MNRQETLKLIKDWEQTVWKEYLENVWQNNKK